MQPGVFSGFLTLVHCVGVIHGKDIDRDLKHPYEESAGQLDRGLDNVL